MSELYHYNLGAKNPSDQYALPEEKTTDVFETVGGNTLVSKGNLQSPNYVPNNQGYTLNNDGSAEFQDVVIAGTISVGAGGTIGGFGIGADYIRDTGNSMGLASTVTGGDDVRFWAGDTYANRATAPFRVTEAGVVTGTQATFTGTINATGGYVGTTTALVYESQGINTGTTGHIRGGQTAFNTGTGFFLGYESAAYKFSVGNPAGNYVAWDGTDLVINGFVQTNIGSFGGDGSDGALAVSSGTTTIDCGNASIVIKNYTSISITGTGALAFSNPASTGTLVVLKSQGAVTITSSATRAIDMRGIGADKSTINDFVFDETSHVGTIGGNGSNGLGGTAGGAGTIYDGSTRNFFFTNTAEKIIRQGYSRFFLPGNGGWAGGQGSNGGASGGVAGGDGGRGGGALYIECGGAWNFTGTIDISGNIGNNGTSGDGTDNGGGGGGAGGSVGHLLALYNTLTANSGTVTAAGGNGGNGGTGDVSVGNNYGGGGGGGSAGQLVAGVAGGAGGNGGNGSNGSNGTTGSGGGGGGGGAAKTGGSTGGTGGTGGSTTSHHLIAQNKYFA